MKSAYTLLFGACLALCALPAAGKEKRVVYGTVLAVEPVTEVRTQPPRAAACSRAKPVAASLTELLAWDLEADCRLQQSERTTHYRVEYAWDGREHTHIMYERPPRRIPLLLTID